jgi:hypothetical protein
MKDTLVKDGINVAPDYCGRCGKNLPPEREGARERIVSLVQRIEAQEAGDQ